ncbi:hypothetical protein Tco_0804409 [Tanacetum coccineum]|uniref:Uncharacterized protein n=1 Tax=Tanacetum coccineum TaxID=301880 RepID=A0ABQ5A739_9ASTR
MSQSLSSNVPDNSPEQEATTGHSILRRLDSPTSQATQLHELELTLTPAIGRELSQESVPILISQAHGPSRKRNAEDKRTPNTPIQDSLAATRANEIGIIADKRISYAEDRRAEDHDQIQIILARLGL